MITEWSLTQNQLKIHHDFCMTMRLAWLFLKRQQTTKQASVFYRDPSGPCPHCSLSPLSPDQSPEVLENSHVNKPESFCLVCQHGQRLRVTTGEICVTVTRTAAAATRLRIGQFKIRLCGQSRGRHEQNKTCCQIYSKGLMVSFHLKLSTASATPSLCLQNQILCLFHLQCCTKISLRPKH